MSVFSFPLRVTPGITFISLRELNGHDELFVEGKGTMALLNLLSNIVTPRNKRDSPSVDAKNIAVSDRDFLLAGIYKYTYGAKIESNVDCISCKSKFDISFLLDDLVAHIWSNTSAATLDNGGFFVYNDVFRFRLPAGEDELSVAGLNADNAEQQMLQRCLGKEFDQSKTSIIVKAMEEIAPVLVIDTAAICPECGHQQDVRFDMQEFLLAKMMNEKKRVLAEVHTIASAYRWSHKEILDLPRSLRTAYAGMLGLN